MSGGSRRGANKTFSLHDSAVVEVDTEIILEGTDLGNPHCFAGVQFFSDADGETPVVPSAGEVVIKIKTINNTPNFEPIPVGVIDASDPSTLSWAANTTAVKATPTDVTGATHYRLVVSCNEY